MIALTESFSVFATTEHNMLLPLLQWQLQALLLSHYDHTKAWGDTAAFQGWVCLYTAESSVACQQHSYPWLGGSVQRKPQGSA